MDTERWAPIPGYEGLYEVSTFGRVLSRSQTRPKLLSASPRRDDGYPRVTLTVRGVRKSAAVHRLVAAAFLGPRPDGMQVRHLNGDASDPRLSNLIYGTGSENMYDRVRHGTNPNAVKTHCPNGHEYTPENTYHRPERPGRMCRECGRIRRRGIWKTSAPI